MAISPVQQTLELIKESKNILIAVKKEWQGDDLASALALAEVFKKIGKLAEVVCQDFQAGKNLSFLPLGRVKTALKNPQKFIISVNATQAQVDEFYYDYKKDKLNIYLSPKAGRLEAKDVATAVSDYKYDLVFVIGAPDLESLGQAYEDQADFFYAATKINLDHSAKNERFGNINLVNLASDSSAEIVYELIKQLDEKLIDENIATCLLTGIILATKNFKTPHLSPQTLNLASLFITYGAKRDEIVKNLYQNRYLSTLKIWGRILARLNNDLDDRLVWSALSHNDFLETATAPEEMADVIDELMVAMPKIEVAVLFYETEKTDAPAIDCLVYSLKNINALDLVKKFNPEGDPAAAKFSLPQTSLAEAERTVIGEIKERMKPQS